MRTIHRFFRNLSFCFRLNTLLIMYVLTFCSSFGEYVSGAQTEKSSYAPETAQAERSSRPAAVKTFDVNTEYGTLAFRGAVERTETQDEYEFLVQIELTFIEGKFKNGGVPVNRTEFVDLRSCELVATIWSGKKEPAEVLYREVYPVTARLTKHGESAALPDLKFHLSKSIAARATHVGLSVTDGKLLWPVAVELK